MAGEGGQAGDQAAGRQEEKETGPAPDNRAGEKSLPEGFLVRFGEKEPVDERDDGDPNAYPDRLQLRASFAKVHTYVAPSDRSYYNISVFACLGYLVLEPDIVFRPRQPGWSVVECVTAGVNKVIRMGIVDPKRIGIVRIGL